MAANEDTIACAAPRARPKPALIKVRPADARGRRAIRIKNTGIIEVSPPIADATKLAPSGIAIRGKLTKEPPPESKGLRPRTPIATRTGETVPPQQSRSP